MSYDDALSRIARAEREEGWLAYCEERGIYQWPTVEWADALAAVLTPLGAETALEIGAGSGALGRALRERGVPVRLTDPNGAGDVERLGAAEALAVHRPDLVMSCWLPYDLGAEALVFSAPSVRWYLAVVQTGPGFSGSEALWRDHGWGCRRLEEADRWSVSRTDYLTEVDRGEHVRHGASFLFSRPT